jgi:hypothetical protein
MMLHKILLLTTIINVDALTKIIKVKRYQNEEMRWVTKGRCSQRLILTLKSSHDHNFILAVDPLIKRSN